MQGKNLEIRTSFYVPIKIANYFLFTKQANIVTTGNKQFWGKTNHNHILFFPKENREIEEPTRDTSQILKPASFICYLPVMPV